MLAASRAVLFVRAMSLAFQSDVAVICLDGDVDEDSFRHDLIALWIGRPSPEAVRAIPFPGPGAAVPERSAEEGESVVVFCQDRWLTDLLLPSLGLGADTVWLVPERGGEDAPEALRLDSNWIDLRQSEEEGGGADPAVVLTELYRINRGGVLSAHLGTWSRAGGVRIPQESKWERRRDLAGTTIVNTVNTWHPFTLITEDEKDIYGFLPDVRCAVERYMAKVIIPLGQEITFRYKNSFPSFFL